MVAYTYIRLDIDNKLAVITLNQPRKRNAINLTMYKELTNVLESLSNNEDITVTAITGAGEYYCSGTDLKSSLGSGNQSLDDAIQETSAVLRKFIETFINHSKILVAVVNGPAIGIAVTTLALCDIVYCTDNATFQTPFTRLGMTAEGCSSYTFPKILGFSKANEMLLFNHTMTATEANQYGLVGRIFKKEEIDTIVWPRLKQYATELPPKSLTYSKRLIRRFDAEKLHEANRLECTQLEERWKSEDCFNAVMKFLNRSKL